MIDFESRYKVCRAVLRARAQDFRRESKIAVKNSQRLLDAQRYIESLRAERKSLINAIEHYRKAIDQIYNSGPIGRTLVVSTLGILHPILPIDHEIKRYPT